MTIQMHTIHSYILWDMGLQKIKLEKLKPRKLENSSPQKFKNSKLEASNPKKF